MNKAKVRKEKHYNKKLLDSLGIPKYLIPKPTSIVKLADVSGSSPLLWFSPNFQDLLTKEFTFKCQFDFSSRNRPNFLVLHA